MNKTADLLNIEIERYRLLDAKGMLFWAPYLRNDNHNQDPNVPRGLGKASPDEIKRSVDYIVKLFPNATGEEIRQKLVDGSLPDKEYNYKGVDCSGFVYHVMNAIYQKILGKELMDDLSVPKNDVINGAFNLDEWRSAYSLSNEEADKLPEDLPLRWVVETFKRKPANLCRVTGLISDFSSVVIPTKSMQVGDLIDLAGRGSYKYHVAIICSINSRVVTIAHSTRLDENDIGGIIFEDLRYDDHGINAEDMNQPCDFKTVRRLKSLYTN